MDKQMFTFYKNALSGAITSPLCEEYRNEWRGCKDNKARLMMLALRQQSIPYLIEHCYKGKGLSKEYILKAFKEYVNMNTEKALVTDADLVHGYTYAMYVAFKGILRACSDVLCLMWCNSPQVEIKAAKSPVIYLGCGSTIHLVGGGYNNPTIYLFDDSKVIIDDMDEVSKVRVYKYGEKAKVEIGKYCLGDVRVFEKELRL